MATSHRTSRRASPIERKTDRLELRVTPTAREAIQRAAAISGLTAGDLAFESARRILDQHQRMSLADADRNAFVDALLNPPDPTERLISALRRRREIAD